MSSGDRSRAWCLFLLAAVPSVALAEIRFTDVTAAAGVTTTTWCGRAEKPHILESNGTGLALLDYDGDGDLDLYVVNGWRLEGARVVERGRDALYRNRGDGVFDDVTMAAGLGQDGWGSGVAVGDVNGDAWPDLFITNFGSDVLYRNHGDGTFAPDPDGPSLEGWSTAAVFFDPDGDGDQDLFVAGYIDCTLDEVLHAKPELLWEGLRVMLGPFGLEGLANRFWRNEGDGRYREATVESGLSDPGLFYSFGTLAVDLDDDEDPDLYVANDSNPNYLYRNVGDGRFEEMGLWSGASLDAQGNAQAGMGVAAGDVDGDGRMDLLVTNFWKDASTLYLDRGDLVFEDASESWGLAGVTYLPLSWGTTLTDLDLDGDLDAFVANGHIYPQADEAAKAETSYRQRNLVLENEGSRFVDRTSEAGAGLEVEESSRGLAAGDWDNDGDVDLAVSNIDALPTLLRNDRVEGGSWIMLSAAGVERAILELGERSQVRKRTAGGSYLSEGDPRFHFGLGSVRSVERLRLHRPGRVDVVFRHPPLRRILVLP